VIDLEVVSDTREGSAFDKAVAWLIGIVALTAACLAVVQVDRTLIEGRAQAGSATLASELSTQLTARGELQRFRLGSAQRAFMAGMAGLSRQLVGLETANETEIARGAAESDAADLLVGIADSMALLPPEDGPLDPYTRTVLAATDEAIAEMLAEQNADADTAVSAGGQGSLVVAALTMVALAAVLAGLAAVLKDDRPGRVTLVLGFAAAGVAIALGLRAVL
jgi:hypothetical protein